MKENKNITKLLKWVDPENHDKVCRVLKRIRPVEKNNETIPDYKLNLGEHITWVDQFLTSAFIRLGSFRAMQREFGIHHQAIGKTVKITLAKLQQERRGAPIKLT